MINYTVFSIDPARCEQVAQQSQVTGRYIAQPWRSTEPADCSGQTESCQYWRIDVMSQDPVIRSANYTLEIANLEQVIYDPITRYIWTAIVQGIKGCLLHQAGHHQKQQDRWAHAECWQQQQHTEYLMMTTLSAQTMSIRISDQDSTQRLDLQQGQTVLMPANLSVSQQISEEDLLYQVLTFEIVDPTTQRRGLELDFGHGDLGQPAAKKTKQYKKSKKT